MSEQAAAGLVEERRRRKKEKGASRAHFEIDSVDASAATVPLRRYARIVSFIIDHDNQLDNLFICVPI